MIKLHELINTFVDFFFPLLQSEMFRTNTYMLETDCDLHVVYTEALSNYGDTEGYII